jgi:hypothetical protein
LEVTATSSNVIEDIGFPKLLESAINECPRLKRIFFTSTESCSRPSCLSIASSLKTCEIKPTSNYHADPRFVPHMSCKRDTLFEYDQEEVATTTVERLRYALLLNMNRLSAELVQSITSLLPNLYMLKIINCTLEKDQFNNFLLDIGGINHLHQLVLDIHFIKKTVSLCHAQSRNG